MRIPLLIAEDNEDDVYLLKMALKKGSLCGPLHFVKDGEEAIAWLREHRMDAGRHIPLILVTDLKMPKVTGFELLKWVRADAFYSKIPVIIYSSSAQRLDIAMAYDLGATNYFTKSPRFKDLITYLCGIPDSLSLEKNPKGIERENRLL